MTGKKQDMSTCTLPMSDLDPGADLSRWHRDRDRAALERLMAASLDRAYAQARRTLGNEADAQDAVQEALLQVMRSAHTYDSTRPFAPWLARLVHVACCRLRWRARHARAREAAVARPDATVPVDGVDAEAVRTIVATLPERDRAAIELHYWAGLSQSETARELGVSENALAVRLHRARERLRGLFAQRGLSLGTATVAVALTPTQAWSAPPALVASVHGLCSTATLPATSIPLGVMRETAWAAARHPWWAAAGVAVLLAGVLTLGAAPLPTGPDPHAHTEVPPPPLPAPPAAWAGPEREILRWLIPQAPLRAAADVTSLRRLAINAKPTSLFFDPQARPALEQLNHRMNQQLSASGQMAMLNSLVALASDGRASAISMMHGAGSLVVSDAGPAAAQITAAWRHASIGKPQPWEHAGFIGWPVRGRDLNWGIRDNLYALGTPSLLIERAADHAALPAPDLPAPAWVNADLSGVIGAFARADTTHSDPLGIGWALGGHWPTLRPRLSVALDGGSGTWTTQTRLSGAVPLSPLALTAALIDPYLGDAPAPAPRQLLRRPDPAKLPVPRPGALATLTLGSTAGWLPAAIEAATSWQIVRLRRLPGMMRLADAWSGDLAVVIEAGAPLPTWTAVIGLRQALDPAVTAELCKAIAPLAPCGQVPGAQAAWQGFTPAGLVTVLLADGRLVISTAPDAAAFLAPAEHAPTADLRLDVDLPRLAATYAPLAYAQFRLPFGEGPDGPIVLDATCLPPLPVLLRHLAPWSATWAETADGFAVQEEGPPLCGLLLAAVAGNMIADAQPDAATAAALEHRAWQAALLKHRERIEAIARIRPFLIAASVRTTETNLAGLSAEGRAALRPFFAGREPTAEDLRSFGRSYTLSEAKVVGEPALPLNPEARAVGWAEIRVVPFGHYPSNAHLGPNGRVIGNLNFAVSLGDGWSVGVIGNHVGLMRGEPPTGPTLPSGTF